MVKHPQFLLDNKDILSEISTDKMPFNRVKNLVYDWTGWTFKSLFTYELIGWV